MQETVLVTRPMQWGQIRDIDEVEPLSDADKECLREMRDVLAKHDRLHRFGVNLIHKHFDIAEDECLVETIDAENRTLTITPRKKNLVGTALETQWQLAEGSAYLLCEQQCVVEGGSHNNRHYPRPDNLS